MSVKRATLPRYPSSSSAKRSRLVLYTKYDANKAIKEKDAAAIREQLQRKEAESKAKQALNMNQWLLLFMIITNKEDLSEMLIVIVFSF